MFWPFFLVCWILELAHDAFDPCTCTDELSCVTISSLKSRKCWQVAILVNNLLFSKIWSQKLQFAYLFLRWHRSRHHVLVRIRNLYGDQREAICWGKSLLVQQASHSAKVTYCTLRQAQDRICLCLTAVPLDLATHDYFLVKKSLAAFAIFRGQCQDTPEALQSLSVQVALHHHPFPVERLPEPAMWMCHTSYLIHRSNQLRPPLPVVSIRQATSASEETSPGVAAPFSWLCPSPSWVWHLRSAGPALSLHHPHHHHPPHHRNLQDHSDCLR